MSFLFLSHRESRVLLQLSLARRSNPVWKAYGQSQQEQALVAVVAVVMLMSGPRRRMRRAAVGHTRRFTGPSRAQPALLFAYQGLCRRSASVSPALPGLPACLLVCLSLAFLCALTDTDRPPVQFAVGWPSWSARSESSLSLSLSFCGRHYPLSGHATALEGRDGRK